MGDGIWPSSPPRSKPSNAPQKSSARWQFETSGFPISAAWAFASAFRRCDRKGAHLRRWGKHRRPPRNVRGSRWHLHFSNQVEGKVALEFRGLGPQNLKNISKPVEAYDGKQLLSMSSRVLLNVLIDAFGLI